MAIPPAKSDVNATFDPGFRLSITWKVFVVVTSMEIGRPIGLTIGYARTNM
jgi:hypothetical protein